MENGKDRHINTEKSGFYVISGGECEKMYLRQTKRNIKTRCKEHMIHTKSLTSAVAQHLIDEDILFLLTIY